MAWKIGGSLRRAFILLHSGALIVWIIISAVIYGFITMLMSVVSLRLARKVARLWSVHLLFLTGVKVTVEGASNIDPAMQYIFVANHQGYFDIPVLYAGLGSSVNFIAKKELFAIPFFGWGMAAIGCISIDRKNPRKARASMTRAVSKLGKNRPSLILFPEGTRSQSGRVGEFKRASFALAQEAEVPVVPVAICGTGEILRKSSLMFRPGAVTLVIGTPIPSDEVRNLNKEELSGTAREAIARAMEKTYS